LVISFGIWAITLLIWDSVVDHILKVVLDEKFELSVFTHWIGFIQVGCLPGFISFIGDIKLNRIISSSDCFDIPVDETQSLAIVNVINVKNTEEEYEKDSGQTQDLDLISSLN
jgi:hypothetical protein